MEVSIVIKYYGRYRKITGLNEEKITVSSNIKDSSEAITRYLSEKYAICPPYSLLVGKVHMRKAIKDNIKLNDGEVIILLPFLSGG